MVSLHKDSLRMFYLFPPVVDYSWLQFHRLRCSTSLGQLVIPGLFKAPNRRWSFVACRPGGLETAFARTSWAHVSGATVDGCECVELVKRKHLEHKLLEMIPKRQFKCLFLWIYKLQIFFFFCGDVDSFRGSFGSLWYQSNISSTMTSTSRQEHLTSQFIQDVLQRLKIPFTAGALGINSTEIISYKGIRIVYESCIKTY